MGKSLMFDARSRMPVTASELFAWHAREGALERLTPPWETTELVERSGEGIREGARVVMRDEGGPGVADAGWRGTRSISRARSSRTSRCPAPSRAGCTPTGSGPSRPSSSVLEDEVVYAPPLGLAGRAFGGGLIRRRLERMFAYRHTVTREDLRRHAAYAGQGPLTVAVTGATGLVGGALVPFLTTGGHRVRRLVRGRADPARGDVAWNPDKGELDAAALEGVDAVVHLAGENVAQPLDARGQGANHPQPHRGHARAVRGPGQAPEEAPGPGVRGGHRLLRQPGRRGGDGGEPPGEGFLATVCRDWEAASAPAEEAGIRVVHLRIGVVMDPRGGALAKLLPPTLPGRRRAGGRRPAVAELGLPGGRAGPHPVRPLSPGVEGPVNAVAPEAVRQRDFARTLGRVLSRPAVMPVPAAAVRALFGEMGKETVLSGAHVRPEVAERLGYSFMFPRLEEALRFTLGRTTAGTRVHPRAVLLSILDKSRVCLN